MPGKGQYSNDTYMLPQQVVGRRGTSSHQLSRLQARQDEMQKRKPLRAPKTTMGSVVCSSHTNLGLVFMVALCSNIQQQQQPQLPSVTQACPATMKEKSALPPLRHNQQVPSQSVQAPNANSSSVNDLFTVVGMIFQQIMTELNGAESEEDRIMAITKILLKLVK
jgi:cytoskeletal protein RodZ